MPIPAALIAGIASSLLTSGTQIALSERQRAHSDSQVDAQNAYNAPSEQVKRLMDAGINPSSLGMGNGMMVQGNTSASPLQYQLPNILDPLQSASNANLMYQQGEDSKTLREARLDEVRANADNLRANAIKLGVDADGQRIINKYADEREKWAIAGQKADVDVKRATKRLTYAQFHSVQQDLSMYKLKVSQALKGLELTQSEIDNNYLNLDWIASKILATQAEVKKTNAEIENIEADTETTENSLPYILKQYEATIENIKKQTGWTDEQTYWYAFRLINESTPSTFGGRKVKIGDAIGRKLNERLGEDYFNVW